jgi:hypothetical protein
MLLIGYARKRIAACLTTRSVDGRLQAVGRDFKLASVIGNLKRRRPALAGFR